MTNYPKIATIAAVAVLLAPVAESGPTLVDSKKPVATLVMNDGQQAGAILDTSGSVSTLGCAGIIHFNEMAAWDTVHSDTDFWDPAIQDDTYFYDYLPSTQSFTLTATDSSGIKRVEVAVVERSVHEFPGSMAVYDDGPSEFFNVVPASAVPYLQPVWKSGYSFSHYEKRLELELRQTRLPQNAVLHFDITHFGKTGRLDITAEDNAGNIATGSVYVAPDSTCL